MTSPTQTQREAFRKILNRFYGENLGYPTDTALDDLQQAAQPTPQSPAPDLDEAHRIASLMSFRVGVATALGFTGPTDADGFWGHQEIGPVHDDDLADLLLQRISKQFQGKLAPAAGAALPEAQEKKPCYYCNPNGEAKTDRPCAQCDGTGWPFWNNWPAPPAKAEGLPEGLRERLKEMDEMAGYVMNGLHYDQCKTKDSHSHLCEKAGELLDKIQTLLATPPAVPAPAQGPTLNLEAMAESVHKAYLETCSKLGWGVKPENQVPYAELTEASKELDRASVRAVLAHLRHTAPEEGSKPSAAPLSKPAEETAWLIENNGPIWVFSNPDCGGQFDYTRDASKAIRFTRKEDAEAVIKALTWSVGAFIKPGTKTAWATEHVWVPNLSTRRIHPSPGERGEG